MSAEAVALPISGALAAFVTYKVKFPSSLFSYHPTLLGVGWLALTPYAIKYLRDSKVQQWCMCACVVRDSRLRAENAALTQREDLRDLAVFRIITVPVFDRRVVVLFALLCGCSATQTKHAEF